MNTVKCIYIDGLQATHAAKPCSLRLSKTR